LQIILREDVKDLGRSGELVSVAEGYARNYLLPRKLAVTATPGNMKDFQKRIAVAKERETRERADAEQVGERIRATRLTLTGRAAEGSTRLHGSITGENVAAALSQALGMPFDKRNVELKNPIRTLGTHQVGIKLLKGMTTPVTIDVVDAAAKAEAEAQASAEAQAAAEAAPAPRVAKAAPPAVVAPPAEAVAPAAETVAPPAETAPPAAESAAPVEEPVSA
jgi:large subunit ribosomal protein L9